jgi:hypothetical protein
VGLLVGPLEEPQVVSQEELQEELLEELLEELQLGPLEARQVEVEVQYI